MSKTGQREEWDALCRRGQCFTKGYGVKMPVHFEEFGDIALAIHRESRLKKWKRRWKMELIEKTNPAWRDLYEMLNA